MQRAGYATDPHYAKKLISILHRDLVRGLPRRISDDRPVFGQPLAGYACLVFRSYTRMPVSA
jgi:hypothetical protein